MDLQDCQYKFASISGEFLTLTVLWTAKLKGGHWKIQGQLMQSAKLHLSKTVQQRIGIFLRAWGVLV